MSEQELSNSQYSIFLKTNTCSCSFKNLFFSSAWSKDRTGDITFSAQYSRYSRIIYTDS